MLSRTAGDRIRLVIVVVIAVIATACAGRVRPAPPPGKPPGAGSAVEPNAAFVATAYCQGSQTATGTRPDERTIAADPSVLPLGSRIRVSGLDDRFRRLNRTYVVGDTGANIVGRRLDIYMRSCGEATRFGRRTVYVTRIGRVR